MPRIPDESKLSCQTSNQTDLEEDIFPEDSYCRFKLNNKETVIQCKNGAWVRFQIPDNLNNFQKNSEYFNSDADQYKYSTEDEDENEVELNEDPCDPNPCQNGGTCLKSMKENAPPICICKPSTQGMTNYQQFIKKML